MPHRFLLALVLLLLAAAPRAAELAFAHFAPGAGDVLLQVDEERPLVLSYKNFEHVAAFEPGTRQLRALRADGTVLVEGSFTLRQSDRYVVILAGNGTPLAPYQFRLAMDHNNVFTAGQWSLQNASLAIHVAPDGTSLLALEVGEVCEGGIDRGSSAERFGHGTATLSGQTTGFDLRMGDYAPCVHYLLDPAVNGAKLAEVVVAGHEGDRLRRFLIGDGVHAPYEMIVVNEGPDPILPVMEPDASIEGLWSIDGESNTGLQVAFDGEAPPGQQISAVYFGFEGDGRSSWRTLEGRRLVEYVGGNVEGTRAAVGFQRGQALITPHSCMEMSMFIFPQAGSNASRIFPDFPRNTLRLTRLFPPVCPPAVPNGQEEKP